MVDVGSTIAAFAAARIVIADDLPGGDLGEKINAAMSYHGNLPSEVWTFGGTVSSQVTVRRYKTLRVLGTIRNDCPPVANGRAQPTFVFEDDATMDGKGPYGAGVSRIFETSAAQSIAGLLGIVHASGMAHETHALPNKNIHIRNIRFEGDPDRTTGGWDGGVHLGNCTNGSITYCEFDGVHNLVAGAGGFADLGHYARGVNIDFNRAYRCPITFWFINADGGSISFNEVYAPGSPNAVVSANPIDLEPNSVADRMANIRVQGNLIDCRGGNAASVYGIAVQKGAAAGTGPIQVIDNTVYGADLDAAQPSVLAGAIGLNFVNDVLVRGNFVQRANHYAVSLLGSTRCDVVDNRALHCGTTDVGGVHVWGSRACYVGRNRLARSNGLAVNSVEKIHETHWSDNVADTDGTLCTLLGAGVFNRHTVGPVVIGGVEYTLTPMTHTTAVLSASAGTQRGVPVTFKAGGNTYRDNECEEVVLAA